MFYCWYRKHVPMMGHCYKLLLYILENALIWIILCKLQFDLHLEMTFLPTGTFPVIFLYICGMFSFKNKLFFFRLTLPLTYMPLFCLTVSEMCVLKSCVNLMEKCEGGSRASWCVVLLWKIWNTNTYTCENLRHLKSSDWHS